ncbi:MAG: homoserine dehydrogenase [Firmicutes bacterium]|nr:homoserine dehydrogenase [Bacillota bacterium]
MKRTEIGVALLGFGNVGSGTYKALEENFALIEKKVGAKVVIKKILVRNLNAPRRVEAPADLFTTDFEEILRDPKIDIVAELLGGINPATGYIRAALTAGKHVVTANKAALAVHLPDLNKAAAFHKCMLRYEASVCGAIPVIGCISRALTANRITAVKGIVNGTTNYILTRMAAEGASYEDVLKDAQALGFAEADPTGDVEGYDAANKLSVLMATAFGVYRAPDSFERVGITGVTMEDLAAAEAEGKVIKLLACAEEKDGGIEAYVKPVAVEKDSFLGRCGSEFNAVQIDCNMAGPIFLQGKGAGPEPTGSAVLGDIIEIAQAIAAGTEHEQPFTALI